MLELCKVGDDAGVEEGCFIHRGFVDYNFDAFGFDALHDALDATGAEVVGAGFHDEAVDSDNPRTEG